MKLLLSAMKLLLSAFIGVVMAHMMIGYAVRDPALAALLWLVAVAFFILMAGAAAGIQIERRRQRLSKDKGTQ